MKRIFKQTIILAVAIGFARGGMAETPAAPAAKTLIVPGESIEGIKLGGDAAGVLAGRGQADYSDAGMGKVVESWYLGERRGDKGRMFHRPDEIGLRAHFNEDGSKYLISQVEVTSPRFATAEGIAPGSTLEAIRAKYPGIQPDTTASIKFWPMYGEMLFFKDTKHGIAFAVRKSDGICAQVSVMPRGGNEYFLWFYPAATQDYVVDDVNGTVGGIQVGMTSAKLLALLGKPDEKRDVTTVAGGALWRWRVPQQRGMDLPALCVYLRKLPDGSLIVDQIRVSSRAFALTDKIFPGCSLEAALQATGNMAKLDTYKDEHVEIYGDLRAGLLFDVKESEPVCTAITIFSPPMDVHRQMGLRWLELPPAVNRDD